MDRRKFLATTVTAGTALSMTSTPATAQDKKPIRIVGVACSSRAGKTTATAVRTALEARGHEIRVVEGWTATFGGAQMIFVDPEFGTLVVASDPRREAYGLAY